MTKSEPVYKYTSDGKKVVVISRINGVETIVQEIFVSNGVEFPSGEPFVAKGLHDQPCISWSSYEQKRAERLENELKNENDKFVDRINQLNKEHKRLCNTIKKKVEFAKSVAEKFNNSALDKVFDFLSGKIKYMVKNSSIIGFNSGLSGGDDDDIRLISLFGLSDGTLSYKLHYYSDGSGGGTTIFPCKTLKEAKEILSNVINSSKRISEGDIVEARKWGIKIEDSLLVAYYNSLIDRANRAIKGYNQNITQLNERITKAQAELAEVANNGGK